MKDGVRENIQGDLQKENQKTADELGKPTLE